MKAIVGRRIKHGLAVIGIALAIPTGVLAHGLVSEDGWGSAVGSEEISLSASPDQFVSSWAGMAVEMRERSDAEDAGVAEIDLDGTTLPAPTSVSSLAFKLPSPWDSNEEYLYNVHQVGFQAPSVPGTYRYSLKWASGDGSSGAPRGGQALLINLEVR